MIETSRCRVSVGALLALLLVTSARGEEADDEPKSSVTQWPTTYIDLSTSYASTPSGTVLFGLRNFQLTTAASKSLYYYAPFSMDVTDRVSIYAAFDMSQFRTADTPWSPLIVGNWGAGFSADIIQQDGAIPTVTLSVGLQRPINVTRFGGYSVWSGGLDFDYTLNEDETLGLTAGLSVTRVLLDQVPGTIKPAFIGYAGAYYQWETGWRLTGRGGVQVFGGANVGSLLQLEPITTPFVAADFERYDDNDNRLIGFSLAVGWTPKPLVQFTLSTPFYFVRQ